MYNGRLDCCVGGRNWLRSRVWAGMTCLSLDIELDLILVWVIEIALISVFRVVIYSISVCGDEIELISVAVGPSELTMFSGRWLTWLPCRAHNVIGFYVGGRNRLVSVWRHQNRLRFMMGIEVDLTSVVRSKLPWVWFGGLKLVLFILWGHPNWPSFCAGGPPGLCCCARSKNDLVYRGKKTFWF